MGNTRISTLMSPSRKHSNSTLSITGLGLAAAATAVSAMAFSSGAYADTVTSGQTRVGASIVGNYVTIESTDAVNIEVIPANNGALGVGKGNIKVKTDSDEGYTLYISGSQAGANGYTPLYFGGRTDSSDIIAGHPNTTATAFSTANTWGYAVPTLKDDNDVAVFSSDNSYNVLVGPGKTTADTGTINDLKWRGVGPNMTKIAATNSKNTDGVDTPIYFGVYVNHDITAGEYANNVVYTAFVEGAGRLNVSYDNLASNKMLVTTEYLSSAYPISDPGKITVTLHNDGVANKVADCDNIHITSDGRSSGLAFECDVTYDETKTHNTAYDVEVKIARNDSTYYTYNGDGVWQQVKTLAETTTMQEMADTTICDATRTPAYTETTVPQKILTDTRDGKTYLVRKFADGNCWMAQNLELDFTGANNTDYYRGDTSTAATHDDDSANYTIAQGQTNGVFSGSTFKNLSSNGETGKTFTLDSSNTDINSGKTWSEIVTRIQNKGGDTNAGAAVYTTMAHNFDTEHNSTAWKNNGDDGARSYSYPASSSDAKPWNYSIPNGQNNQSPDKMNVFGSANDGAPYQRYGNLYNWTAATLGSGLTLTADNSNAEDSICPKGWKLPANTGSDSFYNLIHEAYHLRNSYTATDNQFPSSGNTTHNPDFNVITTAPLDFSRTGSYHRSYGYIRNRTTEGHWWSSSASSATNARRLYTYTGRIPAQGSHYRGYGFAVRCVAR